MSTGEVHGKVSIILELAKCVVVGLAVGASGIPLYIVGTGFFFALRDMGIFILLLLIPLGALCTWLVTRKYLAQGTNRFRGAIAFGARYFFLGSAIGFILTGSACDVAQNTFFGGSIGIMIGSLGGAFQGWIDSRR